MKTFSSRIQQRGTFQKDWSQDYIKNEPMLFNCDMQFAEQMGGLITRDFLSNLPKDWRDCNPVIDSRVHMLMPGFYPCIPGWHHDDVARNTPTGQPNYDELKYASEHLMGVVNGEICPTRFLLGPVVVPDIKPDEVVYQEWSHWIDQEYAKPLEEDPHCGDWNRLFEVKSGVIYQFDWQSFHEGQVANAPGWRWFIRLSRNTDRQQTITNEIRHQVQVYMPFPKQGW